MKKVKVKAKGRQRPLKTLKRKGVKQADTLPAMPPAMPQAMPPMPPGTPMFKKGGCVK